MKNYKKAKRDAEELYRSIGNINSSKMENAKIVFNNIGFNHLIRKGPAQRPFGEQMRRFALLRHAKVIIENPDANILDREESRDTIVDRHGAKVLKRSSVRYWTFIQEIDEQRIKLVVRQIDRGQKHFYSIMGKKLKPKKPQGLL